MKETRSTVSEPGQVLVDSDQQNLRGQDTMHTSSDQHDYTSTQNILTGISTHNLTEMKNIGTRSIRAYGKGVILLFALLYLFALRVQAQTTIAQQDFDGNGPVLTTTNTTTGTGNISATVTTNSGVWVPSNVANVTGSGAWTTNGVMTIESSADVNTTCFSAVQLSFRLQSLATTTANGSDLSDNVTVFVSFNSGATWSSEYQLNGGTATNSNWRWNYAQNVTASGAWDGNNTPTVFGSTTMVAQPSTITLTGLPNVTGLRIRIVTTNNTTTETWTIDNIVLSGTPAANQPIANAGPNQTLTACATSATLAATAPSVGTGAWTVFSGTGTVITPSSPTSTVTGLTPGTPTTLRWTVTNGSCTHYDEVVITSPFGSGCWNYCTSNATSQVDEDITNVTMGTLNNSSSSCVGTNGATYTNFTSVSPPTLTEGASIPWSVTVGTCGSNNYGNGVKIWIDYNNDGDFLDAGENVYTSAATTSGPHTESGSIVIPTGIAVNTTTRMRVIVFEGTLTALNSLSPCVTYNWGETEDYSVFLAPQAPKCPQSTAVTPSADQTVCQGTATNQLTATSTLSNGSGTPTVLYQWYYNTTNSNTIAGATLIAGATSQTYTPPSTGTEGTRYYFCVAYATNNGCNQTNATQSLASNVVKVTVNSLDWANLVTPSGTVACGSGFTAYGQVYEPGVTNAPGQGAGIMVEFGYSTTNTDPSLAGWTWTAASYHSDQGNNDQYQYTFTPPATTNYYYTFRYKIGTCNWQYGGTGGFWNNDSGVLTVNPPLNWANLQWPPNGSISCGSSFIAYGQVYEPGVTPGAGSQGAGIMAEFGYSTTNTDPSTWTNWYTASFNSGGGGFDNDEYQFDVNSIMPPLSPGTYYYTFRYKYNNCGWQYGGYSGTGGGFWGGSNVNGTLTISGPVTPTITAGGPVTFCTGGSVTLTSSAASGNQWYLDGSPISGATGITYVANASGSYTVISTVGGCASAASTAVVVTVNPLPTVTCGGPYGPVCINGATITLAGSPSGGTWSGTGVSGSSFSPSTAGAGSHTLTYTYTDGNGCSNSCTTSITVNPLPTVTCGGPYGPVCINAATITLAGSPSGGTWSGAGVSGSSFSPSTAGAGSHTLTYTYSDANGCSNTCTTSITVNPLPTVTCGGPYGPVCINGATITLAGSPSGGTWSGAGVSGSSFSPSTAGAGSHTLTYTYSDANGCSNTCTTSITVNALPTVTCGGPYGPVCIDGANITLAGSPSGGTWSGTGVSGSSFSPSTAGAGSHTLTYTYTDGNGCSNSCTTSITVNPLPTASNANLTVCDDNIDGYAAFTLTNADATVGGSQTGITITYHASQADADANANALASPYTNTTSNSQTIYARVTVNSTGCYATSEVTLTVNPKPSCAIDGPATSCSSSTNSYTATAGMTSYSWSISGNGTLSATSGQSVDVTAGTMCSGNSYTLSVTVTNANGCTSVCTKTVTGDNQPPQLTGTLPVGQTGMNLCYNAIPVGPTATEIANQYTDNCFSVTVNKTTLAGPTGNNCGWSITYRYTITDACGNPATNSPVDITYTGSDQTAPVIAAAPDAVTVSCIEDVPAMTSLTWTDNCDAGGSVEGVDGPLVGGECGGTITRTWNISDACGNPAVQRTQIITVDDNIVPVLAAAPDAVTVSCIEDVPAMTSLTWTDNCDAGGSVAGVDGPLVGGECGGTITRTWNISDACGNPAVQRTQIITVDDNIVPVLAAAPDAVTVSCIEDVPAMTSLTWTDNCDAGGSVEGVDGPLVGGECGGTITRTWNISDACGNPAVQRTQIITVDDNIVPVLAAAPDAVTVSCIEDVPAMTSLTWTDNCDAGGSVAGVDGPLVGGECGGTITRTWNISDACGNPAVQRTQIITVDDNIVPVLAAAPDAVTVSCIEDVPAMTSLTWTDNCDAGGSVEGVDGPLVGGECGGTITRTWNISDACGNPAVQRTQIITVDDNIVPVLAAAPDAVTVSCIEDVPAMTSLTWTDNCDAGGSVEGVDGPLVGGECGGTITRTWNISDACGNPAVQRTQIITVDDNIVPVLAAAPDAVTVSCIEDVPAMTSLTWTDNCDAGGSVAGVDGPLVGGECGGTITRTWNISDACGNPAVQRTQIITVDDNIVPVLAAAPDAVTVSCIEDVPAMTSLTWTDNCDAGGSVEGVDGPLVGGECGGTITRTWNISDACGNPAVQRTQIITVDDNIVPVLAAAPDAVTVSCIEDVPAMTSLTWTDNCDAGGSVAGVDGPLVGGECGGTITRTWNISDACGNPAVQRTQIITVDDNIVPVLAAAPDAVTVSCIEDVPAMTSLTWTDNCDAGGSVAGVDGPLVGGECGGTITRTWNISDACGNPAVQRTQIITVDDNIVPVLAAAPDAVTVSCIEDVPAMTSLTWTDNCDAGGSVAGVDGPLVGGECGGTITRTWNISDACGNPAVQRTQIITVDDNIVPVLAAAPDAVTVSCIEDVPAMTSLTWTDNCDAGGSVAGVDGPLVGGECGGTITRTWNISDACGNPAVQRTQIITVDDNIVPVLAAAPDAVTVSCIEDVPAMTSLTWTDNCDAGGSVAGVDGPLVGGECGGTITRTWNISDACGNPAVQRTQIITVDDNIVPVLAAAPDAVTVSCIEDVPAMTSLTWTDNCDAGGSVAGVDGPLVGGECGGTITRTWNISDACGNPAVQRTQIITVDDNIVPVLAAAPDAVTVSCIEDVPAMTSLTWTDNCDAGGSVAGVDGPLVGGECGGTITRTWNISDACGNPAVQRTQIITVDDNIVPVLAAAPDAVTVSCIEDVPAMTSLTWTDNCDAGGSVAGVDGPLVGGECGGTITRTWNISDACGNPAVQRTQIITVDDNIVPVLAAAPDAVTVSCIEDVPAMTSLTWTDNCDAGGSVAGVDGPLVGGECGGTITRTWNISDACGNPAVQRTQIITVDDNIVPVLAAAPDAVTVSCIEDVPAMTSLTWTDNCDAGGSVAGVDGPLVGGECGGTITRTWNISDACGNPAVQRTQIITVDDNIVPVLAAAPDAVTVSCIEDVPAMTSLTWTDNCDAGGSVAGVDGPLVGGECGGTITRTWNISDACGNPAVQRTQIITVDDNIVPVLAAAPDAVTVSCIEDVPAMTSLTWTDNCDAGGSVAGVDGPLVGGECGGTITRTWNISDACGNPAVQRTQIITVDDNIVPVLAAAPDAVTVSCIEDVPAMTSLTWTDNCDAGGSVAGVDGPLVGGECGGTITRTWNISDACGNPAVQRTQIITVDDNIVPVLAAAPDAVTVSCIEDVPAMTSLTWTDNCDAGGSVAGVDGPLVGGECGGTITRTWNISDACGNPAVQRTQIITVDDNIVPVLAAAPDAVTVSCIEDVPAMTSLTWTDNCDAGGSVAGVDGPLVGGECGGTITRTWNISDACGNPAVQRTQIITVDDNIVPVLAAAPDAVTVSCIEDVPAMTSLTWTDNCDAGGSVEGVDGPLVGGECGGTITRTWNISDACGNPAVQRTQIITVDDNIVPVLAAAPDAVTVSCIEDVPAMTSLTWTDNCDAGGSVAGVDGPLVGGECGGTITRTWNISDACGNPAVQRTQIITVDDNIVPVLAAAPDAVTVSCIEDVPAMTSLTWTDNCDAGGSVAGVDGPLVGGECGGTITRTWNISDACGNPAVQRTQIITVDDNIVPVLAAAPDAVTVSCIEDVPAMTSLTWTDNCDAGGSVAGVDGPLVGGECGGTITRTWNISDACGNPAVQRTQIITVDDNIVPVLAAAPDAVTVSCIEDVPAMTSLTWTDNCDAGGSVEGVDGPLVGGECGGTITRTWNISDACGNPAVQRTQIITVDDNIVPVLAAAPDAVTVSCIEDVPAMTSLTWTDNCDAGGSVAGVDGPLVGGECGGTITRTWNISDACGNPAVQRTQIITVDDNIVPVLAAAPDAVTVSCIEDVPAMTSLTWTDNCDAGGSVAGVDGPLVGGECGGTITRTWNISDACGNPAVQRTQIITVDDNIVPVLAAAPDAVTVSCIEDVPAMTSLTWTDNCDAGGSVAGVDGPLVGGECGGTITRTWNISDACGNPAVQRTQIITVDDNIVPVLAAAPDAVTVSCIEDVPAMTSLTWTDNCDAGGSVAGVDGPLVGGECGGTITRTWNISDACGNPAVQRTQIITVDDNIVPVLAAAPDAVTVSCIEDVPAMTSLTWTDNCDAGGSVAGVDGPLVGGECGGTITRTWNISDACGNPAVQRTQIITVDDNIVPVLAAAPDAVTVSCIEDVPAMTSLTWTDNCDAGGSVAGVDGPLVGGECGGTITRTWNISDACGNPAVQRTQIITVDDNIVPVLAAAPDAVTVSCIEDVPAMTSLTWTDNCDAGGSVAGVDGPLVGGECGGTITRTWNISDACGNPAVQRTQIITVDDNIVPVLAAAPDAVTVSCIEDVPAMTSLTWTDNCDAGGSVAGVDGPLVGGECGGTITRTWNISDACGNPAVQRTQIITVDDNIVPVLAAAPDAVTVSCIEDVPAMTSLTWTDNCDAGGSVAGVDGPLVGGECGGTITRTWNISDACGNPAVQRTQIITVDDNIVPVLAAAPDAVTVSCIEDVPAMTSLTWTDNCDAGGSVEGVDGPLVGGECGGTITRTWNISDACGNPAVQRTQIITVDDNIVPVLAAAPDAVTVSCIEDVPAMTSLTWTDNCDAGGSVAGVDGPLVGGECGGTITRTWNISDACGNPAVQRTQIITVDDNTPPVITLTAASALGCNPTAAQIEAAFGSASVTDNCSMGLTATGTVQAEVLVSGCTYSTTKNWTVTDACGNTGTNSQTVTYTRDTQAPAITCPANTTIACTASILPTNTGAATATDNCSVSGITYTDAITMGNCGGNYTITRTWTAQDGCGNTSSCTQVITLTDNTGPVISCPGNVTINCQDSTSPSNTGTATATDNCSGVNVSHADATTQGSCPGNYTITRTWTAQDGCGNTSTCIQTITVVDNTPPTASNPANITGIKCIANVPAPDPAVVTNESDNCGVPTVELQSQSNNGGSGCLASPYIVTRVYRVTDACGNTTDVSHTITVIDDVAPVISTTASNADLGCDPVIAPPTFTASDNCSGDITANITVMTAGPSGPPCARTQTWTANVTDACGNAAASVSITYTWKDCTQLPTLSFTTTDNNNCNSPYNGSITAIPSLPGTYTYLWSASAGSQTTQTATGLNGGTYSVTVTTQDGCTVTGSATINNSPQLPVITGSLSVPMFCGVYSADITVPAVASSTNASLSYWFNAAATVPMSLTQAQNATPGTYYVKATGANGCSVILPVTVPDFSSCPMAVDPCYCLNNPTVFGPGFNGQYGESITISGGTGPYIITGTSGVSVFPTLPGNSTGMAPTVPISVSSVFAFALDNNVSSWTIEFSDQNGYKVKFVMTNTCSYPATSNCSTATMLDESNNYEVLNQVIGCVPEDAVAPTGNCTTPPSTFYSFTATEATQVITVQSYGGNLDISVWSSICGNLVPVSCQNLSSGTYTLEGLTPGVTYYIGVGGSYGTVFDLHLFATPTPLTLLSFEGEMDECRSVILQWETGSEQNNEFMEIQRSADGKSFIPLGRVKGTNTNSKAVYTFEDYKDLVSGIRYFYRIRQVDFDGRETMHKIISVDYLCPDGELAMNLYPNPAVDRLNISFSGVTNTGLVTLYITASNGKHARTVEVSPAKINELDLTGLTSGVYQVRASVGDNKFLTARFIKVDN